MKWRTLALDAEAYGLLKRAKRRRESLNDVVRRVFSETATDIDAHSAELMATRRK